MREVVFAICVVGCAGNGGGDPIVEIDLSGVYRVDARVGSEPCGEAVPVDGAPFVKLAREGDVFGYETCTDAEGSDCQTPGLLGAFVEPIHGGWQSRLGGLSIVEGECTLAFFVLTAVLDDPTLTVEGFEYEEAVAEALCDIDEAERRGESMTCIGHVRVEATRL